MKSQLPDEYIRRQILVEIRRSTGAEDVKLPKSIEFELENDTLQLTLLRPESFGGGPEKPENMTRDSAAFEAWALTLFVHYLKCFGKIRLDTPADSTPVMPINVQLDRLFAGTLTKEEEKHVRCYARFLYRADRFAHEYAWFSLSDRLQQCVAPLVAYLRSHDFTNLMPEGTGSFDDDAIDPVLRRFMGKDSDKLAVAAWGNKVAPIFYAQLPVDVCKGMANKEHRLFPSKDSTIQMWTRQGDTMSFFEIVTADKAVSKKRVGVLTKLCFLANMANDLFGSGEPTFVPCQGSDSRGYSHLSAGDVHKVESFLLLDKRICHPLVDQAVFRTMMDHKKRPLTPSISYGLLIYETDKRGKVKRVYCG